MIFTNYFLQACIVVQDITYGLWFNAVQFFHLLPYLQNELKYHLLWFTRIDFDRSQ